MREISTVRSESQVSREMRETWQVCCLASSAPIKNMTGAKKNSNIVTLTTQTWGKLVITRLI